MSKFCRQQLVIAVEAFLPVITEKIGKELKEVLETFSSKTPARGTTSFLLSCIPGLMGIDYNRGSLVFVVLGFQLHLVAMAITGESFNLSCPDCDSADSAIEAFIIIAYLLFLVTFILNMIMNFMGELKGNFGVNVACIVMCLFAAFSCIVAIIIYAAKAYEDDNKGHACAMTTFFTSGACGIIAGVFLILVICGK